MSFISSKQIVQKIIRDYNIVDTGWIEDRNEWVKEALQWIGTQGNKVLIRKEFDVTDKSLELPCDLEDLIGIENMGCYIRFQNRGGLNSFTEVGEVRPYLDHNEIKFNTTNQVTGNLYYYAFKTDCDDDIMLTDHVQVTEAVANYVVMKLMMRGFRHPVITYTEAYQLWNISKDKASNYLNFPAAHEISFVLSEFPNPML